MYLKDLGRYRYKYCGNPLRERLSNVFCLRRVLNVGWLDSGFEFPTGEVHPAVQARLLFCSLLPVAQTRGYHRCHWCSPQCGGVETQLGETNFFLGSAEIRVPGSFRRQYAAPNLIWHYVNSHQYLPPQQFLDAVRRLDLHKYAAAIRLPQRRNEAIALLRDFATMFVVGDTVPTQPVS